MVGGALTRSRCCWALCCCCCFRSLSASCCISSRASAGGFPALVSPEEGAPDQPELPAPGPCCWGACCSNFMISSCCWRHCGRQGGQKFFFFFVQSSPPHWNEENAAPSHLLAPEELFLLSPFLLFLLPPLLLPPLALLLFLALPEFSVSPLLLELKDVSRGCLGHAIASEEKKNQEETTHLLKLFHSWTLSRRIHCYIPKTGFTACEETPSWE